MSNKITKKVMVIPGSQYQVPLIRKAKSYGYYVVCADRKLDCPGFIEADEFYAVGLDERDKLLEIVKYTKPVGILTDQTDFSVEVVAWLSEQAGLRGIGKSCAALFHEKQLMREFSRIHGFATPDFEVCSHISTAETISNRFKFPLIIKPIDCQSSRGVYRINNTNELTEMFPKSLSQSSLKKVIIEEFLEGTEFTVEGFMLSEGHKTLAISEKSHYSKSSMVAKSLLYSPSNSGFDYEELKKINDKWINLSGLPFGMTHAEYIFSHGQYFLIEIAARGGGTRISSDIVPWVSGIDYQKLLLDVIVDDKSNLNHPSLLQKCGLLEFFEFRLGKVKSITGIEKVKCILGVHDIVLSCSIGDIIPNIIDDTTRSGYFILLTETKSDLLELRQIVLETISVEIN